MTDTSDSSFVVSRKRHILALVAVLLVVLSWSDRVDNHAKEYIDGTITQAGTAFLAARGLNPFLTTAKSTELSAGIVAFQPLEVLDPIHDLVEQYSSLMKISIASLLIQKLLIEIISTTLFKVILSIFAASFVLSLYVGQFAYANWAAKLFLMAIGLRFLFVLLVGLNALVDEAFTKQATQRQMAEVAQVSRQLERAGQVDALSDEDEQLLLEEMAVREERTQVVRDRIDNLAYEKAEWEIDLAAVDEEIRQIPKPFIRPRPVPIDLQERRDELWALIVDADREILALDREYAENTDRLKAIAARLAGETNRSRVTDTLTQLRVVADIARLDGIKQRADELVAGILNLMALFFMRTLLMPLVFLYLLVKGYKLLWGVHPMSVLRKATQRVRREITGEATV